MNRKVLTSKSLSERISEITELKRSQYTMVSNITEVFGESAYHVEDSLPTIMSRDREWDSEFSNINFLSNTFTTSTLDKQSGTYPMLV